MKTFNGTFEHNLDSKNRLFIPSDFKPLINGRLVIRLGIIDTYTYIDCFLEDEFEEVVAREVASGEDEETRRALDYQARAFSRIVTVDNGGRICIPAPLLSRANITKASAFLGKGSYFQIWNSDLLMEYNDKFFAERMEAAKAKAAEKKKINEYTERGFFIELKNTLGADTNGK